MFDEKTPYEALFNTPPSSDHIQVFGWLCYAYNLQRRKDKFGERSKRCIFVGHPHGKEGWKVYDIEIGDIFVSQDIIFHEDVYPLATSGSTAHDCFDHVEQPMDRLPSTKSTPWPSSNADSPTSSGPVYTRLDRSGLPPSDLRQQPNEVEPQSVPTGSPARLSSAVRGSVSGPEDAMEASLRGAQWAAHMVPQTEEPVQNSESGPSNRGQRVRKAPSHLQDYFYYTIQASNPSSNASPVQKASSGKSYPITNYVTCNNFSSVHRSYLATITKIVEPRTFQEAVKDPNW